MFRSLFCLFLLLFPQVSFAEVRLAVLEFRGVGISDGLLSVLTDEIRTGVLHVSKGQKIKGEKLIIMTKENMMQVLKDQGLSAEDCVGECEVEIAKNIGADYVISGNLTKVGSLYILGVKMHSTSDNNLLASESLKTESDKELISGAEKIGGSVFQVGLNLSPSVQRNSGSSANFEDGFARAEEEEEWVVGGDGKSGIVSFVSKPEGAVVMVDGVLVCPATPCSKEVALGSRNINIQKERYFPWKKRMKIAKGKTYKAELKRKFGFLDLRAKVDGVSFVINKKPLGESPIPKKEIDAGKYTISVKDKCYKGSDYTFQLKAGKTQVIKDYPLKEKQSAIKVSVRDEKGNDVSAAVLVDRKNVGESPGTFKVPVCSKTLKVKYKGKEKEVSLSLKEKKVKKISVELSTSSKKSADKPSRTVDPVVTEETRRMMRERAHQKRLEYIKELEEVTGKVQGDQKAALLFRLSEQYFQEGQYYHFNEMESFQKEYDKCFNTKGCDTNALKPDHAKSLSWQKKAISGYVRILSDYPRYARADEVLFYLGSAYVETKQADRAVKQFSRLTREYPRSRYLPNAYVNIGEYYFERNNAMRSLAAYKKAAEYKNSSTYGFALYKLAWCYYNVQAYNEAIETMKHVVSVAQAGAQSGDRNQLTLQEESLKDLVRFFADAGQKSEGYSYFRRLGRQDLADVLEKK
ncbi:MAG: PEGA domain-containing protein [Myxococcota bacterium]|nr:PEGA domain-containing protein [Myxococcota bacterium]